MPLVFGDDAVEHQRGLFGDSRDASVILISGVTAPGSPAATEAGATETHPNATPNHRLTLTKEKCDRYRAVTADKFWHDTIDRVRGHEKSMTSKDRRMKVTSAIWFVTTDGTRHVLDPLEIAAILGITQIDEALGIPGAGFDEIEAHPEMEGLYEQSALVLFDLIAPRLQAWYSEAVGGQIPAEADIELEPSLSAELERIRSAVDARLDSP